MRKIYFSIFLILTFICFTNFSLWAARVYPLSLKEVIPKAKIIFIGKIVSVELIQEEVSNRMNYVVEPQEILLGQLPQAPQVKCFYAAKVPIIKDENGNKVVYSSVWEGSGKEYLFKEGMEAVFFSSFEEEVDSLEVPVFRVERIDKKDSVNRALVDFKS